MSQPAESARALVAARYGVEAGEPDQVVDAVAPVVADPQGSVLALALDHRSVRDYLPGPLAPHVLPA
ncbi:MAG: NADPH-dependent oxidoreductase, partial [Cellulomonas sp.]|nr:NADPH-dependent oxidoreductase [Cellulomonas sp.]